MLEEQQANAFRVQAYRNAANTVRALEGVIADVERPVHLGEGEEVRT